MTGVGFYPTGTNDTYDETSSGGNHDFLSRLVVDWEDAAKDSGIRTVFIRAGAVLGRNGGLVGQVMTPFYLGVGGVMGSGEQWMPWIHVKDLTSLIVFAIEHDHVKGVLNGVAPQAITNRQFVEAFAKSLGRPAFIPIPEMAWNLIFGPERAKIVTDGQKVEPKRTLQTGFKFRYPTITEACAEFGHMFYKDSAE